ncbi:MAG TPA: DNA starvation/stationary phase protection protein DpsA [Candidatus Polarisedimenticolia bacterium]|nr:DNA starvation/stationary phase protection protein DpsA [Candidatus Polarisedimenticolia bacterium]
MGATTTKAQSIQAFGQVESNPIGLDRQAVTGIVQALNKDLATAYTLYHQYKKHHWLVIGPQFRDLHLFLDEQAKGALETSDLLAERITALGGVPLSSPAGQQKEAAFTFEEEGHFDIRSSLERDLAAEAALIKDLRQHAILADKGADQGTAHLLRERLIHHENQAHHLDHFLGQDTLHRFD